MAYSVRLTASAQKDLAALPKEIKSRVAVAINGLAQTPRPKGCKKLKGKDNSYRVRVGEYRILYEVYDKQLLVSVVKISSRGGAYK